MVGISKTEVGDSMDLLLGPLADLSFCQPDGTFIASLDDLRYWLAEMAEVGEAVVVDGLATRVQRPLRALVEQTIAHLAGAWALRRWRGLLYRVRGVYRAAGALICLGRWLHRIPIL